MDIRNYILQRIDNDLLDGIWELKFLLLFGDENDIPPIYHSNDNYPSDDFYSTVTSDIYSGDPSLFSGRIPISTKVWFAHATSNIASVIKTKF